jgi:4-amino-4-deoxy-L-arabinose transferase-like glycosyltransferase
VLRSLLSHRTAPTLIIFAVALAVRLIALVATFETNDDVAYYDDAKIAFNVIAGRGFSIDINYRNWLFYEEFLDSGTLDNPIVEGVKPTASKQPLYPLLLSLMFVLFGAKNFAAVFVLHAFIAALTAAILFVAFRPLSAWRAVAIAGGVALYPAFVIHSITVPESTTVVLFLVALLFLCFRRATEAPSPGRWAATGLVGGLLVLSEPVTLPFVVLAVAYAAFLTRAQPRFPVRVSAALVLFVLVLSPWVARNYVVFNRFPVVKSIVGNVFNWGLERSGRGSWIPDERVIALEREGRHKSEIEEDEAIRRELIALFPSHWKEYVTYNVPMNFIHFWWDVDRRLEQPSAAWIVGRMVPYAALLLFALPGLALLLLDLVRQPARTLATAPADIFAVCLIGSFTLVYSIFGAYMSRYRFPVELCLIFFAARTLELLVARTTQPWPGRRAAATSV